MYVCMCIYIRMYMYIYIYIYMMIIINNIWNWHHQNAPSLLKCTIAFRMHHRF